MSWNTRELLGGCLASLAAHGPSGRRLEVIVVDNGSSDGTANMVRRDWPGVRLMANSQNVGYTRANNQAIRVSRGEHLLLINSDALVTDGSLDRMLDGMDRDARVGAVGPRLVYGDGRWQRWTAGRAPTLRAAVNHYLFLERLFPRHPAFEGLYLGQDVRQPIQAEWVSSACMLVRRAALDEVGLLDESLFVYMDDVDLCQRLRDGGWTIWYCPEAEAVHFGSQSVAHRGAVSTVALRSFNGYFARRHGAWAAAALKVVQAAGFALRVGAYLGAALVQPSAPVLRAQARAHWQFFKVSIEPRIERAAASDAGQGPSP